MPENGNKSKTALTAKIYAVYILTECLFQSYIPALFLDKVTENVLKQIDVETN